MRRVGAVRIIFAQDLVDLRDQIVRELTNLDPAVAQCGTKLDAPTLANWATTRGITQHWIDTVAAELAAIIPSGRNGELYEQGIGLEKVLRLNWLPKLTAAGCPIAFPQWSAPKEPPLSTENPGSPLAWLAPIEGTLKLVVALMIWREVKELFE
ncbi:MAG: hypothetical protein KGK07_13640 [Chloroflexota bacterium]|nr:hypothetical protein [Chloroflexota bacterium]